MDTLVTTARIFFSKHYWSHQFAFKKFLQSFFTVCGMAAAAAETGKKLFDLFKEPNSSNWISDFINAHHWGVVGAIAATAIAVALYLVKPTTKVSARLKKRDLTLSIEVGDLFATRDTLVIGTNTSFDTALGNLPISEESLQGQFTTRYFGTAVKNLDAILDAALQGEAAASVSREEKPIGKLKLYDMGTAIRIEVESRRAIWVAMARMNGNGVASTSIEDIRTALSSLWVYISEKAGGLPRLRVPILGTGFGKLRETREEVVREILRSFVAACVSGRFCDGFTLVISIEDFLEHEIDLNELGEFLKYLTTYTEMKSANDTGQGTGLPI